MSALQRLPFGVQGGFQLSEALLQPSAILCLHIDVPDFTPAAD